MQLSQIYQGNRLVCQAYNIQIFKGQTAHYFPHSRNFIIENINKIIGISKF